MRHSDSMSYVLIIKQSSFQIFPNMTIIKRLYAFYFLHEQKDDSKIAIY